jgi:hypothetical protein
MDELMNEPRIPRAGVARLMGHHGIIAEGLAERASCTEGEILEFLDGGQAETAVLVRVTRVLGLRFSDFCIIADVDSGSESKPLNAAVGEKIAKLVQVAMKLPLPSVRRLSEEGRRMPRDEVAAELAIYELGLGPSVGFGGVVIRLLQNRNLNWYSIMRLMGLVTGRYLSMGEYARIGAGRREVRPVDIADFSLVLGIDVGAMAALSGVDAGVVREVDDLQREIPGLIWDMRSLDVLQIDSMINFGSQLPRLCGGCRGQYSRDPDSVILGIGMPSMAVFAACSTSQIRLHRLVPEPGRWKEMQDGPGFVRVLARLVEHQLLTVAEVSRIAGVGEAELRGVLDGVAPDPRMLVRLAPALGIHGVDLLVAAGSPVPDDLLPTDPGAGRYVARLAGAALASTGEQRASLRRFVAALPQEPLVRPWPEPKPKPYEQYPHGPGGVLVRMLHNRNLKWMASANILARLDDAVPLSSTTIGVIGRGGMELTPRLLAGFAELLGIPVGILGILAGAESVASGAPSLGSARRDIAELIWDARRLSLDQVGEAIRYVEELPGSEET